MIIKTEYTLHTIIPAQCICCATEGRVMTQTILFVARASEHLSTYGGTVQTMHIALYSNMHLVDYDYSFGARV